MTPGIAEWFAARAGRDPGRRALTMGEESWTFGEMLGLVERTAAVLADAGLRPGDRIGYVADNHRYFFVVVMAASRLGAVVVPVNARFTAQEIRDVGLDAGLRAVAADAAHQGAVDSVWDGLGCLFRLSLDGAGAGWPSLPELVEECGADAPDPVPADPDAPLLIMYTSGTTGRPKGAVVTNGVLWGTAVNCLVECDFRRDDALLLISPLSHVAIWPWTMCTWLKGGHVVLAAQFTPRLFFELVERHRITTWGAVTPLLAMINAAPEFATADLGSLRWIVCGGAPLEEAVRKRYADRDIAIHRAYGLTEAGGMAALMPPELTETTSRASGRPMLFTELRIEPLQEGAASGEILIRGPNVIPRYWGRAGGEGAVDAGGWVRTGDVGRLDEEGMVTIEDRRKDMIKTGGENVFAAEVERCLGEHPALAEVAVVGMPHPKWGETVVAVASLCPGHGVTLEELREFAGRRLARFKLPTRLDVVPALPRDSVGKIVKYRIREQLRDR
jgi:fatty-acyl-CoA synthase